MNLRKDHYLRQETAAACRGCFGDGLVQSAVRALRIERAPVVARVARRREFGAPDA